jgi:hypothetical protein
MEANVLDNIQFKFKIKENVYKTKLGITRRESKHNDENNGTSDPSKRKSNVSLMWNFFRKRNVIFL